jgi:hypothetical protein
VLDGDWIGHGWRQQGEEISPWIEIDLGEQASVSRIVVFEDGNNIEAFEISAQTRKGWSVVYTGQRIGEKLDFTVDAVKGQVFRISIIKAKATPSIKEIVLL